MFHPCAGDRDTWRERVTVPIRMSTQTMPAPVLDPSRAGAPSAALRGARLLMVAHTNSTHTQRWAHYFQSCGMTVLIISPFKDPVPNVPVRTFPSRERWYHAIPRLHVYLDHREWRSIIGEFRPDLVHVHYPDGGLRNRLYYNDFQRLVTSTWGSDVCESPEFPLPERHKQGVRDLLSRSHVVTATTRFLAKETAKFCPAGKPIHVIPFGVDCDRFRPPDDPRRPTNEIRLGFVKNLERKYGPEQLLAAMPAIVKHSPRVKLFMCGRGDMAQELHELVDRLHLREHVEFTGRIPHDRVIPLVQSLDVMVMPSTCQESFGVAAIEASACEIPVVATQVGGVPEAVVDGQTGLLVPPFDPDALARAIIGLIDDPQRRVQMGRAGRQFVLDNYPWLRNAAVMGSLYEQLLSNAPTPTTPQMMTA